MAAALPVLVLFTTVALGAVDAVMTKLECVDAARDAALATARGGNGISAGRNHAPPGATVTTSGDGRAVRAVVSVRVRPMGRFGPSFTVTGEAVAALEGIAP